MKIAGMMVKDNPAIAAAIFDLAPTVTNTASHTIPAKVA
jgi:hypothetical protein